VNSSSATARTENGSSSQQAASPIASPSR
jgi:hypothetical protein